MEPLGHLVTFKVEGPEYEVETQHGSRTEREKLVDVEMLVGKGHAETVCAEILTLLARRGAQVVQSEPLTEEDTRKAQIALAQQYRNEQQKT